MLVLITLGLGEKMKETRKIRSLRSSQVSPPESSVGFYKNIWGPQEQGVFGNIVFSFAAVV